MSNITTVRELIKDIQEHRTQTSANAKDELRVAMAMLNDPTYVVDVYSKNGVVGQYCPYREVRDMCANIIKDTTKMSAKEATELAEGYQFDRAAAQTMINFSKEYVNTYVETGRKLPLGGRSKSNVQLAIKTKEAKLNSFPTATSVDANGNKVYTHGIGKMSPEHNTIKVYNGSLPWLKTE